MESDKSRALTIVRNAKPAYPGIQLIETFLDDAVDGDQAARYLMQTYADDAGDVNFARFLKDWKDLVTLFHEKKLSSWSLSWGLKRQVARRDDWRCCITGVQCRFWNLWGVFPILPPTAFCIQEQRLCDLLSAFTTTFHLNLLQDKAPENQTRNRWTLSTEAATALLLGALKFEKIEGSKYNILYNRAGFLDLPIFTSRRMDQWTCDLADHSNSGIQNPDPELLNIRSRFSQAKIWSDIATEIASRPCIRRSQNPDCSAFRKITSNALLFFWSNVPDVIRFQTYKILKIAGSYLFEESISMRGVQRLPFGLYLKEGSRYGDDRIIGEFNALKIVRSKTSIPVPRPIDLVHSSTESLLVTSCMEGEPIGRGLRTCSDEEIHQMAQDLRSYIAQLHAIKPDRNSAYAITDTTGGPCLDYRLNQRRVGPFKSEKEFNEILRSAGLPGLMHRSDHKIVLTHGDLSMKNILGKDGKITAIVDWEFAGYFPEYWEFTKCHAAVRLNKRWLKMIDVVFDNKYQEELKMERQYWEFIYY